MQPIRVSSYWTLLLKIFLPTIWIVFFGVLTVFLTLFNGFGHFHLNITLKLLIGGLYILGILLLYLSLLRLKRVEMGEDYFFVTNYFKTFRYAYSSLKSVKEMDLFVIHFIVFTFIQKSVFGPKIYFVRRRKIWNEFVDTHPEQFEHLVDPD